MAHIPFGYRIRNGRAEADPEDARKLMNFISYYLEGMSIRAANKKAGTGRCDDCLRHLLRNRVYLGDDYYPQLISEERFQQMAEELEKRTHPPTRSVAPGTDIKRRFRILDPKGTGAERGTGRKAAGKEKGSCDPVSLAEYVYSLIEPADNGHQRMTNDELSLFRKWKNELLTGSA